MIQAIETEYNGYQFRSRLEARWAVFFDALGVEYEYEPEGLNINGVYYLPDFYLPRFHSYFEVKRKGLEEQEQEKALEKISAGEGFDWAGIICFGDPVDDDLRIFCQESDDGGGGSYDSQITIGMHPDTKEPFLLAYADRRDRSFFVLYDAGDPKEYGLKYIPMCTTEYGRYTYADFVDKRVLDARNKARQARFEHGETPRI